MPLTLVALSSRSALISIARRLAAVSVVKNGLPVPAARMHDAPFLQVAHRAAPDVFLAHLVDADRRHHARVQAERLDRVLHRQRIHDGRQHAHVIAGHAVHAGARQAGAAEDVAAADHDRDLHAQAHDLADLDARRASASSDRCRSPPAPISASPDSLSRMRRSPVPAGAAPVARSADGVLAGAAMKCRPVT